MITFLTHAAVTPVLRADNLMSDPTTTRSLAFDYLTGKVELASCTNVLTKSDTADAKAEIDDHAAAKGAAYDDTRATAPSSYSSW
ncbi:hypothetical protein Ancab_029874 [Ancistrocladus abbreviatus]